MSRGALRSGLETPPSGFDCPPALPITKPHERATRSVHNEAEKIVDWLQVVHDSFHSQ